MTASNAPSSPDASRLSNRAGSPGATACLGNRVWVRSMPRPRAAGCAVNTRTSISPLPQPVSTSDASTGSGKAAIAASTAASDIGLADGQPACAICDAVGKPTGSHRPEQARGCHRVCGTPCATCRGHGRLDGLQDELGRGLGLRHERDVRGRHLHDRRVRALGHEPLERRRDRLVLGAEQVPARQRLPRRRARRRAANAAAAYGRCVAAMTSAVSGRRRRRRHRGTPRGRGRGRCPRSRPGGERHGPDRGPHQAAFEPLEELLLALALVAHPAVEVDERLDLVVADRGGRDDVAAVRVADEHDRTAQGPQELGQVGGVAGEVAKRVAEPDDAVYPRSCRARISASKPVASAHAPWTS